MGKNNPTGQPYREEGAAGGRRRRNGYPKMMMHFTSGLELVLSLGLFAAAFGLICAIPNGRRTFTSYPDFQPMLTSLLLFASVLVSLLKLMANTGAIR